MAVGVQRKSRAVIAIDIGLGRVHLHPADVGHDAGQQHFVMIGLCEEIVTAHLQRPHHRVGIVQAGGKDDGAVVPAAQPLAQVHAVGIRQQDVHEDDIKFFPGVAQCITARLSAHHLKILLALQKIPGGVTDHRIIFHH